MITDLPPSRQSVADPDLDWAVARRTVVQLDGVEQDYVTAYDCEEGWLTRKVADEAGMPKVTADRQAIREEMLRGVVTVRWRESE